MSTIRDGVEVTTMFIDNMPVDVKKAAKVMAAQEGITLRDFIIGLIRAAEEVR